MEIERLGLVRIGEDHGDVVGHQALETAVEDFGELRVVDRVDDRRSVALPAGNAFGKRGGIDDPGKSGGHCDYDTTKGAVHMFARAIAVEYRDQGIRCNAVCPGFIKTPHGLREVDALTKYGVNASEAAMKAQQGRMCEPEEVASAALFLLSDEASFVNGAQLFVDNGFTAI
jgi:NAD(P)-dependent dehydrogenase (short-subunit alcohol dehydrogenase family)